MLSPIVFEPASRRIVFSALIAPAALAPFNFPHVKKTPNATTTMNAADTTSTRTECFLVRVAGAVGTVARLAGASVLLARWAGGALLLVRAAGAS